ncbi:MAG: hypothetical protein ACP5QY_06565, partial [Candidatus Hydrogenedens sp.]
VYIIFLKINILLHLPLFGIFLFSQYYKCRCEIFFAPDVTQAFLSVFSVVDYIFFTTEDTEVFVL